MPEEVVIIVVVAIIAGTISSIVRSIFGYAKSRDQHRSSDVRGAEGSSLTTSELQRMLRAAVEDGTTRLEQRFDALERRMDRLERRAGSEAVPPAGGRIADDLLRGPDEEAEPVPAARRSRTS